MNDVTGKFESTVAVNELNGCVCSNVFKLVHYSEGIEKIWLP